MVVKKDADVSRHAFAIAYDGNNLPDGAHSIQVEALAPALLAFGKLIREANAEFNGKKATAIRHVSAEAAKANAAPASQAHQKEKEMTATNASAVAAMPTAAAIAATLTR